MDCKGDDEGPQTYAQVTNEFADNTNCNGIASVKRSNHFARKAFWTILVLLGAGQFNLVKSV